MKLTEELFYSLNIYREILDHCNDGVNVVDADGILVYVNEISANYVNSTREEMLGESISKFYPDAVLLTVLKNELPIRDKKIHFVAPKKYAVNSYPIFKDGEFLGAFSIFKDIQEIDELSNKIRHLEMQVTLTKPEGDMSQIANQVTMYTVFSQAKKIVGSLGGPRHSIITGESGTGKTMLALLIYNYAKKIGVIGENAPFIEINCAQFTNPDIAAMEIFGSTEGAYTGAKKKKGLFEQANDGILFLDEAHTIEKYQNLLLKAIESGKIRRIGDTKETSVNVIIIAASTKNLHDVLLPELYQRLGQYEMYLPALRERPMAEKEQLLRHFVHKYESAVWESRRIKYHVLFTKAAYKALLSAVYPRNIRQFRDVINISIDASSPLVEDIHDNEEITTIVDIVHIPFEISDTREIIVPKKMAKIIDKITPEIELKIIEFKDNGLGPRRISKALQSIGYDIAYYQIAYYFKKNS